MSIPKIIHFIWAGGRRVLQPDSISIIKMWAYFNSDFKIYLWVDKKTAPLNFEEYGENFATLEKFYQTRIFNDLYSSGRIEIFDIGKGLRNNLFFHHLYPIIRYEIDKFHPNYGASSDIIRYLVLYQYGGVYFDSDVAPNPHFSLKASRIFEDVNSDSRPRIYLDDNAQGTGAIGNDAFICTPRHPFMRRILESIQRNYKLENIAHPVAQQVLLVYLANDLKFLLDTTLEITGPRLIHRRLGDDDIEAEAFYPGSSTLKSPLYNNMQFNNQSLTLRQRGENTARWLNLRVSSKDFEIALSDLMTVIVFEAMYYHILRLDDHVLELSKAASKLIPEVKSRVLKELTNFDQIISEHVKIIRESKHTDIQEYYKRLNLIDKTHKTWELLDENGLDAIQSGAIASTEYLADSVKNIPGLSYQAVPGDGHCLFHAVALYTGQEVVSLREMVVTHIKNNLEQFRDFINLPKGQTFDSYLDAMRSGNEWADHVEIAVLMQVLNRPIVVIGPEGIRNRGDLSRFAGEPIFVFYNGLNHYDALLLTGECTSQKIVGQLIKLFEPTDRLLALVQQRLEVAQNNINRPSSSSEATSSGVTSVPVTNSGSQGPQGLDTNEATSSDSASTPVASGSLGSDQDDKDDPSTIFSVRIGRP